MVSLSKFIYMKFPSKIWTDGRWITGDQESSHKHFFSGELKTK